MQATMSAVESYVPSDNLNNMGSTFDGGVAAAYTPVITPHLEAPISSYPASDGAGNWDAAVAPAAAAVSGEKRKRGRPRKYPVDATAERKKSDKSFSVTPNGKRRGRPPGSGKKQKSAPMGSSPARFTPQIITVQAGEDVSSKIMLLSQNGSQAVCVLSGNGAISNVTLRQASSSGGTVTYEGRFEILSLSGSFIMLESGGQRSRTGGLSVVLAGPDGRVLGGGVAGLLIAATPVQVVIGGFAAYQEPRSPYQIEYSAGPTKPIIGSPTKHIIGSPTMRGTPPSESSGSPINQSNDSNNNGMKMMQWK